MIEDAIRTKLTRTQRTGLDTYRLTTFDGPIFETCDESTAEDKFNAYVFDTDLQEQHLEAGYDIRLNVHDALDCDGYRDGLPVVPRFDGFTV